MNTPGSKEAVENGCQCPVLDNYRGKGFGEPPQFWINGECPIHGIQKETEDVQND